jgi:hypothetical protein
MRYTLLGLLYTAVIWIALLGANAVVEMFRGNPAFGFMQWGIGGRFVLFTFLFVFFLGGLVGFASDRIQKRRG